MEALRGLEELAALAYDVAILREVLYSQAIVSTFFGSIPNAIAFYKKLVMNSIS